MEGGAALHRDAACHALLKTYVFERETNVGDVLTRKPMVDVSAIVHYPRSDGFLGGWS